MGIFSGCLLLSDIDGTFYIDGKIPKRNADAVEYFKSEGGKFTAATGRGPNLGEAVCKRMGINAPALMTNGSSIYDVYSRKLLEARYLEDDVKEFIHTVTQKFPGVGIEITLSDRLVTLNSNNDIIRHQKTEKITPIYMDFSEANKYSWLKVLLMSSDEALLRELKSYMLANKPEACSYVVSDPIFYEVMPNGISKASGLCRLREICYTEKGKTFSIGNYYNDIEMITAADIGAITPDAPEELKIKADFITGDAKRGAVADFIEYLERVIKKS